MASVLRKVVFSKGFIFCFVEIALIVFGKDKLRATRERFRANIFTLIPMPRLISREQKGGKNISLRFCFSENKFSEK